MIVLNIDSDFLFAAIFYIQAFLLIIMRLFALSFISLNIMPVLIRWKLQFVIIAAKGMN